MSMDCGACFAKYLLCLFNFVFFIAGAVVLGIGIWLAADKTSFIQVTKIIENTEAVEGLSQFTQPSVIEQVAYLFIAVGAFVFFVSFVGYCGALRESKCLLACYGVALILILILEITAGGLAASYSNEVKIESRRILKTTISKYYTTPDQVDAVTLFWNHLMVQLECCGVDDYKDFRDSPKWTQGSMQVPPQCCALVPHSDRSNTEKLQLVDPQCPYNPHLGNSHLDTGCYDTFVELLKAHSDLAIGIAIGLGLVQLLGIFLAFCLCKSIERYLK